jgi:GNAT superfamily N-acetyltransferase
MSRFADANAVIRKLRPDEAATYREFLQRLDPPTRRDRFCSAISDAGIAAHVARTWTAPVLVHGCFVDGVLRGAAELELSDPGQGAEAAFVVEPGFRNRGIATALLDVTVVAARNRACRSVRVVCLRHNWAMRRLAQKASAELLLSLDEIEGEIRAPMPTMVSWLREAFVDACDLTLYLMRWDDRRSSAG